MTELHFHPGFVAALLQEMVGAERAAAHGSARQHTTARGSTRQRATARLAQPELEAWRDEHRHTRNTTPFILYFALFTRS